MTAPNGWISVDERVPTKDQSGWMQVLYQNGHVGPAYWHPEAERWSDDASSSGHLLTTVTAWQLFAPPPTDPADEELEGIVEKAMQERQSWYLTPRAGAGSREDLERERLKLLRATLAEIKAWRDKHRGDRA